MKNLIGLIAGFALGALACFFIDQCCGGERAAELRGTVAASDTSTAVTQDTIKSIAPIAEADTPKAVGYRTARFPVATYIACAKPTAAEADTANHTFFAEKISQDTSALAFLGDSAIVEIPITQRVYTDSLYQAWVSGWDASLDSIFVFPRTVTRTVTNTVTNTVTVTRSKTKRWGIGISAGAAVTPRGIEPGVSVGVTYTLWQW